ncbi:sulfite exporter TauE/SafE family protein [Aquabacterium humicola]|uniref:sulfite exporter TauE/SafE family protein n=1 Tax=Aquabacterium humicola TaxID=3237377 RepID=UPI0025439769|nr:sulfite exporter TauE/SafE family protein [Rubrivivax pictus]
MVLTGLIASGLVMGLAGAPHCVAMCGAASAGIGCTRPRLWSFQAARFASYSVLGAAVASSAALLGAGADRIGLLKPFWAMLHVALVVLGISLLWRGRQPAWLDRASQRVWQALRIRTLGWGEDRGPLVASAIAGALWSLLPCGLLYSALMVASLAPSPWQGGAVMAAFAAGSGVGLQLGARLLQRWWPGGVAGRGGAAAADGRWGVRLAGLAVAAASAWALGHGLWQDVARLVC